MNPSLSDRYMELNRPKVGQLLKLLKLDQVYESARGDYLYFRDRDRLIEVLDLLGGYGSTILGHNHPGITSTLTAELERGTPFHAQLSVRAGAAMLAEELNDVFAADEPTRRSYICTLGNSGAEAVEAAIKHALLAWGSRRDQLLLQIERRELRHGSTGAAGEIESARPVVIAFEGSFHGKTAGSVSVTWNETFRSMYPSGPVEVVFIRRTDTPESVAATLDRYSVTLPLARDAAFSRVAGIIYEPIQCEGGIHPISDTLLQSLAEAAKTRRIPLIADEIQTGIWRTGRFLASHSSGISPDYVLLGKGLGGGVAKISALLVATDQYEPSFGMVHTSTYAEDDLSAFVALETIRMLRKGQAHVARNARAFESLVRERIDVIKHKYPGVIRELRGRGFVLGLQFDFDYEGRSPDFLHAIHQAGFASYLIASYLLNRHRVRVGVTLSQADTIRIEPSSFVTDRDALRFLDAVSELARLLHEGKLLEITRHFWRCPFGGDDLETRSPRRRKPVEEKTDTTVGFLTHVIDERHLCRIDALFEPLPKEERTRFLSKFGPFSSPFCYHEQIVRGTNGRATRIKFIGVFVGTDYFETSLRRDMAAYEKVKLMAVRARELGVTHMGLGQYTSIVSENGLLLRGRGMRVTTGNSLTAGFAYQALLAALDARGIKPRDARIGIVGATGNICNVLSQLLGDAAGALRLVYREPLEQSRKFQEAVAAVTAGSSIDRSRIETSHEPSSLCDCDAIVLGTNTVQTLLLPEHLREGAIVLDISVPSNVDPRVFTERPDVQCFHGGLARLPLEQAIESEWIPTPKGETFCCVAETLTTALTGRTDDFSVGPIAKARVLEAIELANSVGITVGSPRPLKET